MAKVEADRRDARVEVDSKDGCGEPSLPGVEGGLSGKDGFVFWLGVMRRTILVAKLSRRQNLLRVGGFPELR